MEKLHEGVYERLLDVELRDLIDAQPELRVLLRSIDDEAEPATYSQFLHQLLQKAFRITRKEDRLPLLNRLIELLSATEGLDFLARKALLQQEKKLLMEVSKGGASFPRPVTPMSISALLTGQGTDPPLEHELRAEMITADRVDILVSFIKWSGLRLLRPAFEKLTERGVTVRIISTSYMGASDPEALDWLATQSNVQVRVSYDTAATRLHAKAYHFIRKTGLSTAYIGSANMSHSAMTQGLEWTMKVTAQDMPHILARFNAEFESYWERPEFESYESGHFRKAITSYRNRNTLSGIPFFADITARPYQLRILEALEAARQGGSTRNLVVAATGTGKTVISALDYKRFSEAQKSKPNLLFVAHRKEILEQALGCFRTVLRDQNFGELLVDGMTPSEWKHVFASIQSLNSKQPWQELGTRHFSFVVVDEVHHGAANSYRPLFKHLQPDILLGLTATPERMDGSSVLPDFDHRFAAEIRLPEALEEKLLCPFHYFGVSDNMDFSADRFWSNGRYDSHQLEEVLTGDDIRAKQRIDLILQALHRYQPDLTAVKGIGFCVGVRHAQFMADHFNSAGIPSTVLLGNTLREQREERLKEFKTGRWKFLFTVDVLSEGVDIPEVNLVMFLRPTESLTVFLQQLGRGLRHAPQKDCLTVLDFVGQTHRRYRLDTRFSALLSQRRRRLDLEVENDFPHLPPGCSIQLERVARERVLEKIKQSLSDLKNFVSETIKTWETEENSPLTFGRFVEKTGLSPQQILSRHTWSAWKAMARDEAPPSDLNLEEGRKALMRIALRTDPEILQTLVNISKKDNCNESDERILTALHYILWGQKGENVGISTLEESVAKWRHNKTLLKDVAEVVAWRRAVYDIPIREIKLPFPCPLKLHAAYGSAEIKAALGLSTLQSPGPTGQGVIHAKHLKAYIHLVTFRKEEKDFSPTTRYQDYPISRTRFHWESQSTVAQDSATGQNYIHARERNYTILFFARLEKRIEGETAPFIYLGPTKNLLSYEGNRPISMVWELEYPMPSSLFEEASSI